MKEPPLRRSIPSGKVPQALIIGITGQIASGKSSVAEVFRRRGAEVISGDQLGRNIVESEPTVRKALIEQFGAEILTKSGQIDRRKLGRLAFESRKNTEALNHIVHPILLRRLRQRIAQLRKHPGRKLLVVDAALIYYWGLERELDFVIVVESKSAIQKTRLMESGLTPFEIRDRISRQVPKYVQRKRADFVIMNNGNLIDLEVKSQRVIAKLLKELA